MSQKVFHLLHEAELCNTSYTMESMPFETGEGNETLFPQTGMTPQEEYFQASCNLNRKGPLLVKCVTAVC